MNKLFLTLAALGSITLAGCNMTTETNEVAATETEAEVLEQPKEAFGGFESREAWGGHLVTIGGCHDCHTPKVMSPEGMPEPDMTRTLSGHPADAPIPNIDRAMAEKNLLVSTDLQLTSWVGPWGVSYAANLTPDKTGIGTWTEEQFFVALREGKFKGLPASRPLLPPMPWQMIGQMTDDEMRAVFAYLKSLPPVKNVVPAPMTPVSAPPQQES